MLPAGLLAAPLLSAPRREAPSPQVLGEPGSRSLQSPRGGVAVGWVSEGCAEGRGPGWARYRLRYRDGPAAGTRE